MSCKKGEGLWYFGNILFDVAGLTQGKRYTIILLGDGEVLVRGYATLGASEFDEDFRLHFDEAGGVASVSMKSPFFSNNYIYGFDIILRDDEQTLAMIPNVSYSRV